jgi:hypothetical protein
MITVWVTVAFLVVGTVAVIRANAQTRKKFDDTATRSVLRSGTAATARVLSLDWAGAKSGVWYVCRIGLRVELAGREPYDVTVQQRVEAVRLPAVQPGATVAVRIDPANPLIVGIDFR